MKTNKGHREKTEFFSHLKRSCLRLCLLAGLGALTLSGTVPANAEPGTLVFGIVPQQSATRLAQTWIPFLNKLSKISGQKLEFATTKDIPSFEACLAQNAYDIAYMNPYHYTVFHISPGYEAFAQEADKRLQGIIVARKDSPIETLEALREMNVAFPSPAAFGASIVPRAEMEQRGITITPHYVKSHDSVYRSVALGLFPAGGGVKRTFGNIAQDIRDKLKIIYETSDYTSHAFAFSARVPQTVREKIAASLLTIDDPSLLGPLGMKGFETAKDEDWNDVRALNLTRSETQIVAAGDLKCHSD